MIKLKYSVGFILFLISLNAAAVINWYSLCLDNSVFTNVFVFDGQVAKLGQFPYQVLIVVPLKSNTMWCGGTIISKKFVLTAAHCIQKDLTEIKLTVGTVHLTYPDSGSITLVTTKFIVHPQFDSRTLINDIAVIELPQELEFNEQIQPIKLPGKSDITNLFVGENATLTGWGIASPADCRYSDLLRFESNPIISNDACAQQRNLSYLPTSQLCQSTNGIKGACRGDDGNPLIVTNSLGETIQIGIVSDKSDCLKKFPATYTRITTYLEFIEQNTDVKIDE